MPMNDRFKFRTYIPDLNFFKYWGWIDKGHFVGFCASGDYSTDELLEKYTQQCTGLKDKNGKLIYEGDILRYPPKEQYEEKNYVACEVFFHNNDCCDNHIGFQMNRYRFQGALRGIANFGTKYKFIPKNTEKMEIIGNIYHDSHLLENTIC